MKSQATHLPTSEKGTLVELDSLPISKESNQMKFFKRASKPSTATSIEVDAIMMALLVMALV
jgi:hypothetical protein